MSKRPKTPEYVAKLMRVLREGGLVQSTRGAGGGYRLVRPPADVTIFDPTQEWTLEAASLASKSKNTPFDRWSMKGKVTRTIVAGRSMWGEER